MQLGDTDSPGFTPPTTGAPPGGLPPGPPEGAYARAQTIGRSARATFVAQDTLLIHALHEHVAGVRDLSSYLGLLLLLLLWMRELWANNRRLPKRPLSET